MASGLSGAIQSLRGWPRSCRRHSADYGPTRSRATRTPASRNGPQGNRTFPYAPRQQDAAEDAAQDASGDHAHEPDAEAEVAGGLADQPCRFDITDSAAVQRDEEEQSGEHAEDRMPERRPVCGKGERRTP